MAAQDSRCESAPAKHGFGIVRRVDVVFKAGRKPHICVCVCARLGDPRLAHPITELLVLRDSEGKTDARVSHLAGAVAPTFDGAGGGRCGRVGRFGACQGWAALRAAVAAAEALGVRADPGSEAPRREGALAQLGVRGARVRRSVLAAIVLS